MFSEGEKPTSRSRGVLGVGKTVLLCDRERRVIRKSTSPKFYKERACRKPVLWREDRCEVLRKKGCGRGSCISSKWGWDNRDAKKRILLQRSARRGVTVSRARYSPRKRGDGREGTRPSSPTILNNKQEGKPPDWRERMWAERALQEKHPKDVNSSSKPGREQRG